MKKHNFFTNLVRNSLVKKFITAPFLFNKINSDLHNVRWLIALVVTHIQFYTSFVTWFNYVRDSITYWPTITFSYPWFKFQVNHGTHFKKTKTHKNQNILRKSNRTLGRPILTRKSSIVRLLFLTFTFNNSQFHKFNPWLQCVHKCWSDYLNLVIFGDF